MVVRGAPILLAVAMLLTGCGGEQVEGEEAAPPVSSPSGYTWEQDCGVTAAEQAPHNPQRRDDPSYNADEYVGLSIREARSKAEAAGLDVRLLGVDGDCEDRTDDLRSDRVNFYVEDETVRAAALY
jgi:hypothetical protein